MSPDKRRVLFVLVACTLLCAALSLPARGLGRAVVRAAGECANRTIGGDVLGRDLELRFEPAPRRPVQPEPADRAWTLILRAQRYPTRAHAFIHLDLHRAFWLPLAVFIALALASPIWQSARGLIVVTAGVLALQIPFGLSLLTNACGLLYENYVIDLSEGARSALRLCSTLLTLPGMVYATPLLLWAALLRATRPGPRKSEPLARLVSARSQ